MTSSEWPHAAAVEREKRQRAAAAFEQALLDGTRRQSVTAAASVGVTGGSSIGVAGDSSSSSSSLQHLLRRPSAAAVLADSRKRVRIQSEPVSATGSAAIISFSPGTRFFLSVYVLRCFHDSRDIDVVKLRRFWDGRYPVENVQDVQLYRPRCPNTSRDSRYLVYIS